MNYDFMSAHGVGDKQKVLQKISTGALKTPVVSDRDWLKLPEIKGNEQKMVGLYAIHPGSNFIALRVKGAYTVDWGDGTVENFNNNNIAEHEYKYDLIDPLGKTITNRGFKQVIVTVTPQNNHSITSINLHLSHSIYNAVHSSGFIDISINAPSMTELLIGTRSPGNTSPLIRFAMLERFKLQKNAISNLNHLFYNCFSLRDVVEFDASSATSSLFMFYGCNDLRTVKLLNTENITRTNQMFQNCYSLEEAPFFDTSRVTSMESMFLNCYGLKTLPLYNMANVTLLDNFLYNCYLVETTPVFNTGKVTSINDMFRNCYSLLEVPEYDFSNVSSANNLFVSCTQLYSIRFNNMKRGFSIASCKLSSEALNDLYGRLGIVSNQLLTVVGNYGVRADSIAIATAKGWTVSG